MNGHLLRCRCVPVRTYRPRTLRSDTQGAQRAPVAIFDGPTTSALCALHPARPSTGSTNRSL